MIMKFGLTDKDVQKINAVFAYHPEVETAILYGSRAKGNFRNGSDIDLTLVGKNLNLTVLNQISLEIDDLLLPYMFDLSIHHFITDKDMLAHIHRVGKFFYEASAIAV